MAIKTKHVAIPSATPNDVKALIWSTTDSSDQNLVGVRWDTALTAAGMTIHWYADNSWSKDQVKQIKDALGTWAQVANITFDKVSDPAAAEIVIINEDIRQTHVTGVSGTPELTEEATADLPVTMVQKVIAKPGQVLTYIDMTGENSQGGHPGDLLSNYGIETLIHEIGHALGLKHSFEAISGNTFVFPGITDRNPDGAFDQNENIYTVMSYTHVSFGTIDNQQFAASPMAYDIAAVQLLYGAKTNANAGNTTYKLVDGDTTWTCIWDTGGSDTISYKGGSSKAVIDLRPATLDGTASGGGYLSYVYDDIVDGKIVKKGGFTISGDITNVLSDVGATKGVIIENAEGGNNDDDITGNDASNTLRGNDGNDTLKGLGAADFLYGGNGNDNLDGGDGNDQLYGGDDQDTLRGGQGDDTINGGRGDDRIFGEENNDQLFGGEGNDRIEGGSGQDLIYGDEGDDILKGGLDNDTLKGGAGKDDLNGNGGADILYGGVDDDTLDGGADNDALYGGDGVDLLRSSRGNDYMDGGAGIDTITYSQETKSVSVDLALKTATIQRSASETDTDTLVGIENVVAGLGSDIIRGNGSDNIFSYVGILLSATGTGGFDDYFGGGGHDTVDFTRFTTGHLNVDLSQGIASGSWFFTDPNGGEEGGFSQLAHLSGIESVIASFGADTVSGDALDNTFTYVGSFTRDTDTGGFDDYTGGGGRDTVDFSRFTTGHLTVDLAGGLASATWSYTDPSGGSGFGFTQLARLSGIQSVIASYAGDTVIGDDSDNTFTYVGSFTRDTDTGGFDDYTGGGGHDTVDFSQFITGDLTVDLELGNAFAHWSYSEPNGEGAGAGQIAQLSGIDSVVASLQSDIVYGNDDDNVFTYVGSFTRDSDTGGIDTYSGRDGFDILDLSRLNTGGTFVDLADGTSSASYSYVTDTGGGGGARELVTFSSIEGVIATLGNDDVTGSSDDNTFSYIGAATRTSITGGYDTFRGGDGIDTIDFSHFAGKVTVNLQDGAVLSAPLRGEDQGIAKLYDVENAIGGDQADHLFGSAGANTLSGGNGNDYLNGAGGDDILAGGDLSDTFRFDAGFGHDTITDFAASGPGHDYVELSTSVYADWDALVAAQAIADDGAGNAVLSSSDGLSAVAFLGISATDLLAAKDDFLFV